MSSRCEYVDGDACLSRLMNSRQHYVPTTRSILLSIVKEAHRQARTVNVVTRVSPTRIQLLLRNEARAPQHIELRRVVHLDEGLDDRLLG